MKRKTRIRFDKYIENFVFFCTTRERETFFTRVCVHKKIFASVYIVSTQTINIRINDKKSVYRSASFRAQQHMTPRESINFIRIREVNGYSGGEKKGSEKLRWLFFF